MIDPQVIIRHIEDGLLVVDPKGYVLWANSIFAEMIGRSGQSLEGLRCCDLGVGSFCSELCPVGGEQGATPANGAHFNVQVANGRGELGTYCFVTSVLRDEAGGLIGFMENFRGMDRVRDVIMQLEEVNQAINAEREKTEQLIASMADGVFSVDEQLRIRRINRSLESMLGLKNEDVLGQECRAVLRGSLCDGDCPLVWSRDRATPLTDCREELLATDGRRIPVAITTGLLRNEPDFANGLFGVVTDRSEVEELRQKLDRGVSSHGMIGHSSAMQALFDQIDAVAPTDATVLITGESGTGKELVARAIHSHSERAAGPFVSVNCAALVRGTAGE